MFAFVALAVLSLFSTANGALVWNGSFNAYPTVATFDNWSWSNEVGEYQWYIHGTEPTSHYLALDPSYKNPADTSEINGLKMTIDSTAQWNSQMERTELIPQTTTNLGVGTMYYHFSIMHSTTNVPDTTLEHQIFFFESHFTELKIGVSPVPTNLQWMVSSVEQWGTPFVAGTWFNFAYEINFSAGNVGLWASTGSAPLTKVANNVAASTSTNSEDWHVGVLRIVNNSETEDFYVSGVYIENGTITTSVGSGSAPASPPSSVPTSAPPSSAPTSSPTSPPSSKSTTSTPTTSASGATQTHYGQCGGTGWTGATTCASPYTCTAVSPPYYSQCL